MDYEVAKTTFERACADVNNPQTRQAAEALIVQFRNRADVIPLTKYILERSTCFTTQFMCLQTLRDVAAREFSARGLPEMKQLREWVWSWGVQNWKGRPPFVHNMCLATISVICKRGWLEETNAEREAFFNAVAGMLGGEDTKHPALNLFSVLIEEFSSENKYTMGLSLDDNLKCRRSFEEHELRHIYQLLLRVVQHSMSQQPPAFDTNEEYILTALQTLGRILAWDFADFGGKTYTTTRFPNSWKELVLNPEVVNTFVQLSELAELYPQLSGQCAQCLTQLCSITGDVFKAVDASGQLYIDENIRRAWVECLLIGYLKIARRYTQQVSEDEDLLADDDLATLIDIPHRLISNHPIPTIISCPSAIQAFSLTSNLSLMTYSYIIKQGEDVLGEEVGELMLDMWSRLVVGWTEWIDERKALETTGVQKDDGVSAQKFQEFMTFLSAVCEKVFEGFVEMRLTVANAEEEEEDHGSPEEMKDVFLYEDQLTEAAILARVSPEKALSMLEKHVIHRLAWIEKALAGDAHFLSQITTAFEHLHWLALICGHVLADKAAGETPEMPEGFGPLLHAQPCPLITLPSTFLTVIGMLSCSRDDPVYHYLSPLVSESLLWFAERWSCTYLFMEGGKIGNAFNGEAGRKVLDSLIDSMSKVCGMWWGETEVIMQVSSLLSSWGKMPHIRQVLLESDNFKQLARLIMDNLGRLPVDAHSPLVENITTLFTHAPPALRSAYLGELAQNIHGRYFELFHNPNFAQTYQHPEVREQVICSLEMYSGLALACNETNTKQIFAVISEAFEMFVGLIRAYKGDSNVEQSVLSCVGGLVRCANFDELSPEQRQHLYHTILELLRAYANNQVGRTRVLRQGDEEEVLEDLCVVVEMLWQLVAGRYEGLSWSEVVAIRNRAVAAGEVDVAELVFYGVGVVVPLISDDMLQFPELCKDYITLVSNLTRYFPDKFITLPQDLVSRIIRCLEIGVQNAMAEVARGAWEAIFGISIWRWETTQTQPAGIPTQGLQVLDSCLDHLLQKVVQAIFFSPFNMSGEDDVSAQALLGLILGRESSYGMLAHQIGNGMGQPAVVQALGCLVGGARAVVARDGIEKMRYARMEGFLGREEEVAAFVKDVGRVREGIHRLSRI
ncbi:armadillo-type protein [Gaertneriomyces semiglobifer]|nr:armadillo-type protein [Gaertneriomyces semiglobifer]